MPDLVVYATDVTDLGRGFTTVDGSTKGYGLVPQNTGPPTGGDGVQIAYTYTLVETIDELATSMDLNASLSMRFGLFGSSGKFSFAQKASVHDESLFICLNIKVQRAATQLKPPITYDPVALEIRKTDPAAFRAAYGDAYVAATRTGGELGLVLEIHTHSSQERQDIAASLKGNYGVTVDFDGSFKKSFEQQSSNRMITAQVYQVGGSPIDLHSGGQVDPLKVLDEAQAWLDQMANPDDAVAHAVIFQATLLPWETAPVAGGPTPIDIQVASDLLDELSVSQRRCIDRLALLNYVTEHPDEYDFAAGTSSAEIDAQRITVETTLAAVLAAAKTVAHDVQHPPTPADLAAAYAALPPRPVLSHVNPATAVPDVFGLTEAEALATLQAAGFQVAKDEDTWNETSSPGLVSSTNPGRGAPATPGDVVHYSLTTNDPAKKPLVIMLTKLDPALSPGLMNIIANQK
jgi:hypothetical protein